jgi:thiamine-phosphate pyrophosphorylase
MEASDAAAVRLEAVLAVAPIACVILAGRTPATLRPLVDLAQKRSAAVLLVDDAGLAQSVGADGVHLTASEDIADRYQRARKVMGPGATIGGEVGASRHLAMELGEAGADYVAFGPDVETSAQVASEAPADDEPGDGAAFDAEVPRTQVELAIWWSELFEVPCIALDVREPGTAAQLSVGGVEFVGVLLGGGQPVAASVAAVTAVAAAITGGDA